MGKIVIVALVALFASLGTASASMFQQHPDNLIYVRTPQGTYMDTTQNFVADNGSALPALPPKATERIYDQGKRHTIMGDGNVIAGGPMPWAYGDKAINDIAKLLTAQEQRRHAH
jgi:hypothetical protein